MITADPVIMGRSRHLSTTYTYNLNGTVAFSTFISRGTGDLSPRFIAKSSIGGTGFPELAWSFDPIYREILTYGWTYKNVFHEIGRLNMETAPGQVGLNVPGPSPDYQAVAWGTVSFGISVSVVTEADFQDVLYFTQLGLEAELVEIVPPSGSCTRTTTVNGESFVTVLAAPSSGWNERLASAGSYIPQALGIYPAGFTVNVSAQSPLVTTYFDNTTSTPSLSPRSGYVDFGHEGSGSGTVSISGVQMPAGLGTFSAGPGSGGNGAISVGRPSPGQAFGGSCSLGVQPLQTIVTNGKTYDMAGNLDITPRQVEVYLNDGSANQESSRHPFTATTAAGAFSVTTIVGGAGQTVRLSDSTNTWSETTDNYLRAADGVTTIGAGAYQAYGTPLPILVGDPISKLPAGRNPSSWIPTSIRGYSSFEQRLPVKGGGIRIRQKPELVLFGNPWPASGWYYYGATSNGVAVSRAVSGALNVVCSSVNAQGFSATARYELPTANAYDADSRLLPYRFLRLRVRSVGSSNKKISVRLPTGVPGVQPEFTGVTGPDGEWTEIELDCQRQAISNAPQPSSPNIGYRDGVLLLQNNAIEITGLQVATYEIESIRGIRRHESLLSVMRASPPKRLSYDNVAPGVRSIHAATDGLIGLSSYVANYVVANSIELLVKRLNTLYFRSWEAEVLQPARSGRPPAPNGTQKIFALQPADITDALTTTYWLAGGGQFKDGSVTLDKDADDWLTIPIQPVLRRLIIYPGAGQPFAEDDDSQVLRSGPYGNSTTLNWQTITRSQVVGIMLGGPGSQINSTVTVPGPGGVAGAPAGSATCSRESGWTPTNSPHVPMGATARITGTNGAQVVAYTGLQGDPSVVRRNGSPWDYADFTSKSGLEGQYLPDARMRAFVMFSGQPLDKWLSTDVSESLRLVRGVLKAGKLRIDTWTGSTWTEGTVSEISCVHPTVRYARRASGNQLVIVSESISTSPKIERRVTGDEGRTFSSPSTVFPVGYYPAFCVAPSGLEYHFALASSQDGGAINAKIVGAGGQQVVAAYEAVPAAGDVKSASIAAIWQPAVGPVLVYQRVSDDAVVMLRPGLTVSVPQNYSIITNSGESVADNFDRVLYVFRPEDI